MPAPMARTANAIGSSLNNPRVEDANDMSRAAYSGPLAGWHASRQPDLMVQGPLADPNSRGHGARGARGGGNTRRHGETEVHGDARADGLLAPRAAPALGGRASSPSRSDLRASPCLRASVCVLYSVSSAVSALLTESDLRYVGAGQHRMKRLVLLVA